MLIEREEAIVGTTSGPMRSVILRPNGEGRHPGLVFYSEIFQITAPVLRLAAYFAGHGFVVAVPEVYHEFEHAGTILGYDDAGKARGNALKTEKTIAAFDDDARFLLDHLASRADCTGRLGAVGICLGGHLAFRAALDPRTAAAACFYATDIHSATLGKGGDDSLKRAGALRGEVMMIFGRQDPHIPAAGRRAIHEGLEAAGVTFTWHEFNAAHAFLRDDDPRFDAEAARIALNMAVDLFRRRLASD